MNNSLFIHFISEGHRNRSDDTHLFLLLSLNCYKQINNVKRYFYTRIYLTLLGTIISDYGNNVIVILCMFVLENYFNNRQYNKIQQRSITIDVNF